MQFILTSEEFQTLAASFSEWGKSENREPKLLKLRIPESELELVRHHYPLVKEIVGERNAGILWFRLVELRSLEDIAGQYDLTSPRILQIVKRETNVLEDCLKAIRYFID